MQDSKEEEEDLIYGVSDDEEAEAILKGVKAALFWQSTVNINIEDAKEIKSKQHIREMTPSCSETRGRNGAASFHESGTTEKMERATTARPPATPPRTRPRPSSPQSSSTFHTRNMFGQESLPSKQHCPNYFEFLNSARCKVGSPRLAEDNGANHTRNVFTPECPKQKAHDKQPTPNVCEFFNSARCKLEGSHCHKSDSLDSLDSHRLAEDDGDHPSVPAYSPSAYSPSAPSDAPSRPHRVFPQHVLANEGPHFSSPLHASADDDEITLYQMRTNVGLHRREGCASECRTGQGC